MWLGAGECKCPWRPGEGAHGVHGSPRAEVIGDCEPLQCKSSYVFLATEPSLQPPQGFWFSETVSCCVAQASPKLVGVPLSQSS